MEICEITKIPLVIFIFNLTVIFNGREIFETKRKFEYIKVKDFEYWRGICKKYISSCEISEVYKQNFSLFCTNHSYFFFFFFFFHINHFLLQ
jgi:hypothetical protein